MSTTVVNLRELGDIAQRVITQNVEALAIIPQRASVFLVELTRESALYLVQALTEKCLELGVALDLHTRPSTMGGRLVVECELSLRQGDTILLRRTGIGEALPSHADAEGVVTENENALRAAETRAIKRAVETLIPVVGVVLRKYSEWVSKWIAQNAANEKPFFAAQKAHAALIAAVRGKQQAQQAPAQKVQSQQAAPQQVSAQQVKTQAKPSQRPTQSKIADGGNLAEKGRAIFEKLTDAPTPIRDGVEAWLELRDSGDMYLWLTGKTYQYKQDIKDALGVWDDDANTWQVPVVQDAPHIVFELLGKIAQ